MKGLNNEKSKERQWHLRKIKQDDPQVPERYDEECTKRRKESIK